MQHYGINDVNCGAKDYIVISSKRNGKLAEARSPTPSLRSASGSLSKRKILARSILRRCDTFRAAGLDDPSNPPLVAGGKTNFMLFCLAFGYKCYRSIFINKMAVWERQPQWNTVMTSREMEIKANLKTMTCKTCGTTIFIAKGRKWFQMPKGYECYGCGTVGDDNFVNVRDELLDEIEDDYFDYEKPLDFVTAAERRSLMKEAGGDESKANALLQGGSAEVTEGQVAVSGEVEKKKKKKKGKKKKKKKKKALTDDVISEEGGDVQTASGSGNDANKSDGKPTEPTTSDEEIHSKDSLDDLDMDDF